MDFRHARIFIFTVIGSMFASVALAGSYTQSCPNATIPCARTAWDIGIEGDYIRPVNSDLSFQEDISTPAFQPGLPSQTRYIKPEFHWGGRIIGSYHWGYGNDVTIHYSRFRDRQGETAYSTLDGGFVDQGPTPITTTHGAVEWKYDSFAIEFGQVVKLGNETGIRLHAGGEYAKIFHRLTTSNGGGSFPTILFTDDAPNSKQSEFKGFGGRFGMDAWHKIKDNFYVVAHGTAGILIGHMNLHIRTGDPFVAANNADNHDEFQSFVPTYEARGGIAYKHRTSNGKFKFELGYQAHGYAGSVVHAQDGIYDFDNDRNHISEFGMHGPYLQVKYVGMS